jgi:magnesium-transporting ATPase (P-type)
MEELDLLKRNWQQTAVYHSISEIDIYKMLHKKSSSVVQWILVISVLELGLGLVLGLVLSYTKYDNESKVFLQKMGIYNYYLIVSVLMYLVVFYFIFCFYKVYKKIKTEDTVKDLIHNILKTRKVVKQYIAFNLTSFAVIFIIVLGYGLYESYLNKQMQNGNLHPDISFKMIVVSFFIIVLVTGVLTFLFWLFYKLLYGILLKKLKNNYIELMKIDL